jgi:hypothetical protein
MASLSAILDRNLGKPSKSKKSSSKKSSSKKSSSKGGTRVKFTTADGTVVDFKAMGKRKSNKPKRPANAYARFAGPRVRELMSDGMSFGKAGKKAAREWNKKQAS